MDEIVGIIFVTLFFVLGALGIYRYFRWVYRLADKKGRNPFAWIILMSVVPFGMIFIPWYLYYLPPLDKTGKRIWGDKIAKAIKKSSFAVSEFDHEPVRDENVESRSIQFKKHKIRVIIAREGLIIIFFLLFAGASFFLDFWLNDQKKVYESTVQEVQLVEEKYDEEQEKRFFIMQGIILQFPQDTSEDVIKHSIKRDFPNIHSNEWIVFDSPEGKNIAAFYDKNGSRIFESIIYKVDFHDVYIFFLFFAYPLYWLMRFIIWAIGILKSKT